MGESGAESFEEGNCKVPLGGWRGVVDRGRGDEIGDSDKEEESKCGCSRGSRRVTKGNLQKGVTPISSHAHQIGRFL